MLIASSWNVSGITKETCLWMLLITKKHLWRRISSFKHWVYFFTNSGGHLLEAGINSPASVNVIYARHGFWCQCGTAFFFFLFFFPIFWGLKAKVCLIIKMNSFGRKQKPVWFLNQNYSYLWSSKEFVAETMLYDLDDQMFCSNGDYPWRIIAFNL